MEMTNPTVVLASASATWVGWEIWLIVRDRIKGAGGKASDRGTRCLNFVGIIVGIGGAACTSAVPSTFFPGGRTEATFWAGIAVMAAGLALRMWAVFSLGVSFRTTVETHESQKVMQGGPYALIRHPSYSGILLMCCGYGVAVQNWISLGLAVVPPFAVLLYRIRVEENFLSHLLGSTYTDYMKKTKRLIPFLW
jgi:protein-S-isoprenylcysteine O-methyltransferase Ste14